MFSTLLAAVWLLQSGTIVARSQATPPLAAPIDWLVVVAVPVYQPDGGVLSENVSLPAAGAGLVHVFARRSVCDPAVSGATEPSDAGFGWRVASQIVSRSERDVVVSLDWRRLWDAGRKVSNGPGGTVQLTLHPGDRIPLDHIVNASPRADCRAVGLGLEVRLGRAPASAPTPPSTIPIGATPGGARPVDAELWLMHTLPSGVEQVTHQLVRVPASGGAFSFAPTSFETAGGKRNVQLEGSIDRYRTPSGGEFFVLSMTRLVTGDGLPEAGARGTTGSVFPLPLPTDVLSFEMPAGRGRGGAGGGARGGGSGGGVRGGGGAGAGGVDPARSGLVAGGAAGGQAGARGGGGAAQLTTLLEGHQFALRLKVTEAK